jgi:hypothetical protein
VADRILTVVLSVRPFAQPSNADKKKPEALETNLGASSATKLDDPESDTHMMRRAPMTPILQ